MNIEELIALVEAEWDLDNGFFGRLRKGQFDTTRHTRTKQTLERIQREVGNAETLSRRLVSLFWYVPLFMSWQAERVKGSVDPREYEKAANGIQTIVQGILGVP
jgi:hypothetical protein